MGRRLVVGADDGRALGASRSGIITGILGMVGYAMEAGVETTILESEKKDMLGWKLEMNPGNW